MKNKKINCSRDESHNPRYAEGARFCQECGAETYLVPTLADKVGSVVRKATSDVAKVVGTTSKSVANYGFKAITYPIVGNLSGDLQTRLENLVGEDWFDALDATRTSMLTNLVTYPTIINLLDGVYSRENIGMNDIIGLHILGAATTVLTASFFVGGIRGALGTGYGDPPQFRGIHEPEGTFCGWLASLPIKGVISAYEGIKNYVGKAIHNDKIQRRKSGVQ